MAILTFTTSPEKGTSTEVSLNKTELAALSEVSSDSYFSDQNNWSSIRIVYGSTEGGQKVLLYFDPSEITPTTDFVLDATSRNVFEVLEIRIIDKMLGKLIIPRSSLNTAEFDVDATPVTAPSNFTYLPDIITPSITEGIINAGADWGVTVSIDDGGELVTYTLVYATIGGISDPALLASLVVAPLSGNISNIDTSLIGVGNQAVITVEATNSQGSVSATLTVEVF